MDLKYKETYAVIFEAQEKEFLSKKMILDKIKEKQTQSHTSKIKQTNKHVFVLKLQWNAQHGVKFSVDYYIYWRVFQLPSIHTSADRKRELYSRKEGRENGGK